MKKLFFVFASALMLGTYANAQETFYPGWNFGIQGGATYTAGSLSTEKSKLISPVAAINVGYEFNPWFGLRADISGWQAKGYLVETPSSTFNFNYAQLGLDAMFDICNMFKYKSTRLFNPYVFVGPGLNYSFGGNELATTGLAFCGRAGLGVNIRLCDAVKLSLEVVDNLLPNKFNSVKDNTIDQNLSALLGLKFTFGQAKAKREAEAAAAAAAAAAAKAAADKAAAEKAAAEKAAAERAAAERAAAERAAAERAAAEAAAAKAKALQDAKDAINAAINNLDAYPRFVIGRSSLNKEARKKVAFAAEVLKVNPEIKVDVTGYADKETGTAKLNWELSKKRAENVVEALIAEGIQATQLVPDWKGDTEKVSDVPSQNRTVTFRVK